MMHQLGPGDRRGTASSRTIRMDGRGMAMLTMRELPVSAQGSPGLFLIVRCLSHTL
jgi:hypothetical protein